MSLHRHAPTLTRCATFLFLLSGGWAHAADPKPALMVVLGDSIPSASLADTKATPQDTKPTVAEQKILEHAILLQKQTWQSQSTQGWGKSLLEQLIKSVGLYENKKSLSWASGLKVDSHFVRLRDWLKTREDTALQVANLAVPGAKAQDLEEQVRRGLELAESGRYSSVKYVALMIGANDACSRAAVGGTPNDQMIESLRKALSLLARIRQTEPIRVLVSSLPQIPDLGRPEIRYGHTLYWFTCDFVRSDVLRSCNPMVRWNYEGDYLAKLATVDAKNRIIADLVDELNARYPQLSIHFSQAFARATFTTSDLAFDCFHPNATGHQRLSRILWNDQPWFK